MLKIRVGIERGRIPAGWENVSIEQAQWMQERVKQLPSGVIAYYESLVRDDTLHQGPVTEADMKEWLVFTKEALYNMCGMTPFGLGRASEADLLRIAQKYLPVFVLGVLGYANLEYRPRTKFRFGRTTYFFPASGRDITGEPVPFSDMTAIEFCTVSDLIALNDLSVAPVIVATCCHRKGERYDEKRIMSRAEAFKKLPMSIYWHIWAAMNAVHEYLRTECPDCFPKSSGKAAQGTTASWVNTLMQLVADKPSELDYVQAMPCYDFVRLLNVNIKKLKEEWKIRSALRF